MQRSLLIGDSGDLCHRLVQSSSLIGESEREGHGPDWQINGNKEDMIRNNDGEGVERAG